MIRLYRCTVHWADELVRNGSDFSLLSDLIACVDDLVTAESQLVLNFKSRKGQKAIEYPF